MSLGFGVDRDAFDAWLAASCAAQGVPVELADPVTIQHLGTLLGRRPAAGRPRRRGAPQPAGTSDAPGGNDPGQEVA